MIETAQLSNHFLIAMPMLEDSNFFHSVTYLAQHDEHGALGVVINHPDNTTFADLADHLGIDCLDPCAARTILYRGGPVQPERGFVLHRPIGNWHSTLAVGSEIGLTTSRDVIEAIARGDGPQQWLVALGYAGWGPGQLEQELADNAWLSSPSEPRLIFDSAVEQRWGEAAALLGIDLARLAPGAGHA